MFFPISRQEHLLNRCRTVAGTVLMIAYGYAVAEEGQDELVNLAEQASVSPIDMQYISKKKLR
jgi:hypothetical protein